MKKIFTTMFAMAAMFCASAAVPTYSVSPADDSVIENRDNLKVIFTFSEEVKADSVQFASGPRFNRTMTDAATNMKAASKTISVDVPATAWGEVVGSEYILTVTLTNISDKSGAAIKISDTDETGETVYYDFKAVASYTSPAPAVEAKLLSVSPAPGEMNAWEVYNDGWGAIEYHFSDEVNISDMTASIRFVTEDDKINQRVSEEDIYADWDFWSGDYIVVVYINPEEGVTADNLESITVSVAGIKTMAGKEISIGSVVYSDTKTQGTLLKKAPGTASITLINEATNVEVYTINGTLVSNAMPTSDIVSLKPGLYVVNGRKIIVK